MIGFAAYWNMNIVFSQAALAGLTGMLGASADPAAGDTDTDTDTDRGYALLDVDDTSSRSTATPSRAPGSATPGSAA